MKKIILMALVLLTLAACATDGVTDGGDLPPQPDVHATPRPLPDQDGDIVAMRIGDVEITSNEYRYHYYSAAQSFISYYGSFIGIDPSQPFEEQYIDDKMTWADFFADQAAEGVRNTVLLSEQARMMGMTLDENFESQITERIEDLKDYCAANGLTLEQMLREWYGGNMDESKMRAIMERTYLGYQFEMYKRDSVDVSDDVLQAYYDQNAAEFDVTDYLSYMFETREEADACLAAITDRQSFYNYIAANFEDDMDNYLVVSEGNTGDEFSDWLFDGARAEGDTAVIEAYDVFVVMYFIRRYRPDDESLSIRHVLISGGELTPSGARARAEEIYDEWKSGDATEETFALLAGTYSEDPGSSGGGGLYEDVQEGQMVQAFNDWCFDPARRPGDTGLVDTEYGTHIMYYTGNVLRWKNQVKMMIIENTYAEFYEPLLERYQVEHIDMDVSR
ncbi:MAG: peptidylprolyl isomerase [Oscillospiraceae bacterium]|nr:peptidylprolyl isomerase [Oscillospiraceae bacterium]